MPQFSVILPALRPELAVEAIKSILAGSRGIDFEIVVVSPFKIEGARIRHVPESENQAKGNCPAHAAGYAAAAGDIIVAMTDDHIVENGWLNTLAETIRAGEEKHFPFCGGINRPDTPWIGVIYGLYYPYFPVMSRRSAEAVGGWFCPDYIAHYGDSDLALRVWAAGGRCEFIADARIRKNANERPGTESPHKTSSIDVDFQTLVRKHHARFGVGFQIEPEQINCNYSLIALNERSFTGRMPPLAYLEMVRRRESERSA